MWNQENLAKDLGVQIEQVWDWYMEASVLEDMGVSHELIQNYYEAKCVRYTNRDVVPLEYEFGMDVYLVRIPDDLRPVKDAFKKWIHGIVADEANTGADDGTYDYYPDVWFVGSQLAVALGSQVAYRGARKVLMATTRYGEDEDLRELIPAI